MMSTIQGLADERVLRLTTIGRRTGVPREVEIWFVILAKRFYLFAETGEAAGWVRNIRQNPAVVVKIAGRQMRATARVLDWDTDTVLRNRVARLAERKYGWGDGLPVELTPHRTSLTSAP